MTGNRRTILAVSMLAAAMTSGVASAQTNYPEHTIKVIVPFAPGGATDAVSRPWVEKMRQRLGSLVQENMGGAGGGIGAAAAARSKPDGYTLLIGSISTQVITPVIANPKPYDPLKDFETIAMLVVSNLAFAVTPSMPVKSLKELAEYAQANRGKVSFGTPGTGSLNHLLGELFKDESGAEAIVHVPYRGGGPALNDLLGGQLPMLTPVMTGQIITLHNSGKLRVLAITGAKRIANLPDVPTATESGYPNIVAQGFFGLFAPAGTPRPIVEKIAAASRDVMNDAGIGKLMLSAGFEPVLDSTPQSARAHLEADIRRWTPIIAKAGIKR